MRARLLTRMAFAAREPSPPGSSAPVANQLAALVAAEPDLPLSDSERGLLAEWLERVAASQPG